METKKELPTTEEIQELFTRGFAARKCRDRAIVLRFSTRRAIKFGIESQKAFDAAWRLIDALHPETRNGKWHYNSLTKTVREGAGNDA